MRRQLWLAVFAGVAAAVFSLGIRVWDDGVQSLSQPSTDFDHVVTGARLFLSGADPYALIGPGRTFEWPWRLYFPATALVVVAPFTLLPVSIAGAVFMGLCVGVLAYVSTRASSLHPLVWFVAAPMSNALYGQQFSPLLAGGGYAPALLGLGLAVKPTVAAALVAHSRTWRDAAITLAIAFAVFLVSLCIDPRWPQHWLALTIPDHPILALSGPAGWFPLLALTRWRRPEARLLAALACVPQTFLSYELLALMLVPRTAWEHTALVAGASVFAAVVFSFGPTGPTAVGVAYVQGVLRFSVPLALWTMYIPATVMVLRRPNDPMLT